MKTDTIAAIATGMRIQESESWESVEAGIFRD